MPTASWRHCAHCVRRKGLREKSWRSTVWIPRRSARALRSASAEQDGIILISTDSLAEGLNLQQRCFNLIHLDLPYNPNRLEQRNGRIDRYGQPHDPQIRYLYLAGTFEERLLLRLIAKYEKARAHLTFMPDTLGVTADEGALSTGLIAGFAERQAQLFEDEPPFDSHAGSRSRGGECRGVSRPVARDRPCLSRIRPQCGAAWLAGGSRPECRCGADAGGECGAAARRCIAGSCRSGGLCRPARSRRKPAAQVREQACCGFPPTGRRVWMICQATMRRRGRCVSRASATGCATGTAGRLAFLGRAHPVVRRAISSVRRIDDGACDTA